MLAIRFQNDDEMKLFLSKVKAHIGSESEFSCLVTESQSCLTNERHVTHKILNMLWDKVTISSKTINEEEVMLSDITMGGQLGFFRKVGDHDFNLKKYDPVANSGVIMKFRAQEQVHDKLLNQIRELTETVNKLTIKYCKSGDAIVNRFNEPESLCTPTVRSLMDTYLARHVSAVFLSKLSNSYMFTFTINCLSKNKPRFDKCTTIRNQNGYHLFKFDSYDKNAKDIMLYELPLSKFSGIDEVFKTNVENTVCAIYDGQSKYIKVRLPTPVELYSLNFQGDLVYDILDFDSTLTSNDPYNLSVIPVLDTLCSVSLIMEELNYQESIKVNRSKLGYYKIYEQMISFLEDRRDSIVNVDKRLTLEGFDNLIRDIRSLNLMMENMADGNECEYDNTLPWTEARLVYNLAKHNNVVTNKTLTINFETLFARVNHPLLCGTIPKQWMSKLAKMKEYSFVDDNPTLQIGILEVLYTRDDKKVVSLYPCKICGRIWSCLTVRHLCEMLDFRYISKDGEQYMRGKQKEKYINIWSGAYSNEKPILLPKIDKIKLIDYFPKNQHKYMNDSDVEKMRLNVLDVTMSGISSSISTLMTNVSTTLRRNKKKTINIDGVQEEVIRLKRIIQTKLSYYYELSRTTNRSISDIERLEGVECVLIFFLLQNFSTGFTGYDIKGLSKSIFGLSSLFVTVTQKDRGTLCVGYDSYLNWEVINIMECLETPKCCGTMSLRKLPTARLDGAVLRIRHASSLPIRNDWFKKDALYKFFLDNNNCYNHKFDQYISYYRPDKNPESRITYEQLIDDEFSFAKLGWLSTTKILLVLPQQEDLPVFLDVLSKFTSVVYVNVNYSTDFHYKYTYNVKPNFDCMFKVDLIE